MTTAEAITVTANVAVGIAAFVGMLIAASGLNTWRQQLKGSVEYELTRRLLKHTYRLREAIRLVRHPSISYNPAEDVEGAPSLSREQREYQGLVDAYRKRWEKIASARDDLQTELLEAEVVWDDEIHKKFEALFQLQNELSGDIQSYLAVADPQATFETREAWDGIRAARRSVMYDMLGYSDDPFSAEVKAAISNIESYLKPHLKK